MKKLSALMLLSATMILASCGETKPAESSKVEESTSEVVEDSSAPAAESSTPAPTTSTPATSSKPTPTASSKPTPTASSTSAPVAEDKVAFTGIDLLTESNKAYIKISGTIDASVTAAQQKMAFGLNHKSVDNVDEGTGGWIIGSATPAAADYKLTPVVAADGKFELKVDVSDVTFVAGAYSVWAGIQGEYTDVTGALFGQTQTGDASDSQFGGTKVKTTGFKLYFRDDVKALIADALPPVELTEAFFEAGTGEDEGKVFVLIGGELGETETEFKAHTPFVQFQKMEQYELIRLDNQPGKVELVVRGTKGYVKADITSLDEGYSYNTHLNITANTQADCKMDADLNTKNTPVLIGTKELAVYSNTAGSGAAEIYGNLGIFIKHKHVLSRGEKVTGTDMWPVACPGNDYNAIELDLDATNTPSLGSDKKMNSSKKATFNITGIESGEYEVYIKAHTSNGNHNAGSSNGLSTGVELNGLPGRYYAQVGGAEAEKIYTDTGDQNFNAVGFDDYTQFKWSNVAVIPSVMIGEGETSFIFAHTGAGYSMYVETIRLVKKGVFKMTLQGTEASYRFEAEKADANFNGAVVESAGASGGKYATAPKYGNELYIPFTLANDANAKFVVGYSCHDNPNSYGAVEFYVDNAKVPNNENIGTLTEGATSDTPIWTTAEIPAMALTAGEHQIKMRLPWGSKSYIDYVDIQFVAAAE